MFAKKTGPKKVEAAFGLFTKAINDLEAAVVTCREEEVNFQQVAAVALAKAEESIAAGVKAELAVVNLKALIGE
jgi:hypothetical protein